MPRGVHPPARVVVAAAIGLLLPAPRASATDIPLGQIVDDVRCAADPAQSYALYVPSNYSPDRRWSVLLAFHPAARGRAMVEKYMAAAERYGYIVAASNNSRNGPWAVSAAAAVAMPADVGRRFAIDPKRLYLTGMSGGARVAMQIALANKAVAGVIASSAGYPDSQPRSKVPFAVFATAGTEDFNYLEMRMLDRRLETPHHLAVFEGGHSLPPDTVALDAIEWMELQAMTSGRRSRDDGLIDRLLEKRRQAIAAAASPAGTIHLLEALVADFEGLRDVSADAARAKDLRKQPDVLKALDRERAADDAEARTLGDVFDLEAGLLEDDRRLESLMRLRTTLAKLAREAAAAEDSPGRSQARRVLRAITAGAAERVQDREYRALLDEYRLPGRGNGVVR